MKKEIERKFIVQNESWRTASPGILYCQGYLSSARECTVRVRTAGDKAFLTIKGPTTGPSRTEYEYEIPQADARALLAELAEKPLIEKIRHKRTYDGLLWEIDEFLGENQGLIVAELELKSEEQAFDKPDWAGEELTDDPRYFNSNLTKKPFGRW